MKMTLALRSMFQTWVTVLARPGIQVFEAERLKPSATLTTALVWTVLAGVVVALLELLHAQLYPSPSWSMWPLSDLIPPVIRDAMETTPGRSRTQILAGIVTAPIFLLISVGVQHLIASAWGPDRGYLDPLGGKPLGKFGRYAYLNATFGAPLSIINSLLNLVPLLHFLIAFIMAIYGLVLTYYATKAEYGLSRGRAIVVILAGPLLVGVGWGLVGTVIYYTGIFN